MKIVHLSWTDITGGAARAAWRVHRSIIGTGVRSSMIVGRQSSRDPDITQYVPTRGRVSRLVRRLRRLSIDREMAGQPHDLIDFWGDRTIFGSELGNVAPDVDLYHLHQITQFLDYSAIPLLAARAPIVWTLHEMTAFTGGCSYAYECDGFTRECGGCPQLGSANHNDWSHAVWTRKQRAYAGIAPSRIHVVGASQWIASEARRSALFGRFPVSVIPYGLDTEVFRPMPGARRLLDAFGVPSSARVVLFIADDPNIPRKGFQLLDTALGTLGNTTEIALVSVGQGAAPKLRSGLRHIHLGALTEDRMIAAAYSMADVFVIPSLQDNLPNTVLEAIACGTPVVGFRVGGIPEMVREGENGLLVPPGDVAGLAHAIERLLADEPRRSCMSVSARRIAEREYAYGVQAERYLGLYRSFLGGQDSVMPRSTP